MEYVFNGFRQVDSMRHYAFQGIAADHSRRPFIVATDITLLRKYSIALQDMPLLCRRFLEEREGHDEGRSVMLGEEDMRRYADKKAAALLEIAARKRKHQRVVASRAGQ